MSYASDLDDYDWESLSNKEYNEIIDKGYDEAYQYEKVEFQEKRCYYCQSLDYCGCCDPPNEPNRRQEVLLNESKDKQTCYKD